MPRFVPALLTLLLGLALGGSLAPVAADAQAPDPCAPTAYPAPATATSTATAAPTATASPAPSATLAPVAGLTIYDDATAAGWSRSGYTVTISDVTGPVYSGAKAMRLAYGGWGGVRFSPSSATSLSGTLTLALRGSGKLRVIVGSTQIGLLTATDAWTVYRLPLPGGSVTQIELKNDLSTAATMFVDALAVETPAGAGSVATPTPPPSTTPTLPPVGAALRILPLGDSITEGPNGSYRDVLYQRLTAAGYSVDYVGPRLDQYANGPDKDHAGTPGFNSGNILANVDGYLATYRPDVVLLMIGTNDLAWWTVEQPADVVARVGQILDKITAAGARPYLATIPPAADASVPPNGRSRAQLVADYNVALRQFAAARGVPLVDVGAALTLSDLYDGIHPSEAAHDTKIAPLWAAALGAP